MYVCMYVCMHASIVSKRLLQHGGRALVPPPAAFSKSRLPVAQVPYAPIGAGPGSLPAGPHRAAWHSGELGGQSGPILMALIFRRVC